MGKIHEFHLFLHKLVMVMRVGSRCKAWNGERERDRDRDGDGYVEKIEKEKKVEKKTKKMEKKKEIYDPFAMNSFLIRQRIREDAKITYEIEDDEEQEQQQEEEEEEEEEEEKEKEEEEEEERQLEQE